MLSKKGGRDNVTIVLCEVQKLDTVRRMKEWMKNLKDKKMRGGGSMKNRMQDLDFEQNVAFDKVQEYEFTRRAAQRFRQVVSLDSFEDEDADVYFPLFI